MIALMVSVFQLIASLCVQFMSSSQTTAWDLLQQQICVYHCFLDKERTGSGEGMGLKGSGGEGGWRGAEGRRGERVGQGTGLEGRAGKGTGTTGNGVGLTFARGGP